MDIGAALSLLMTPEGRDDPYPLYDAVRAHGPLVRVDDRMYVATGFRVIDDLLRDPHLLVPGAEFVEHLYPGWVPGPAVRSIGRSMLQTNPPDHTRMRRLAAGAFTARRVAGLREVITAQAATLVEYLAHLARRDGIVDFVSEFAYPLPIRVICALLGVPAADQQWFRERASTLTVILEPLLQADDLAAADRAVHELETYLLDLIRERRREPRDDLTTALVQAHDTDTAALTADELLANLILLLVAGFETTTNLLCNGLVVLLRHPDHAAGLRADPTLAARYVEELLRFDAPVQLTTRWTHGGATYRGMRIGSYSQILLLLGAGNRDPQEFAEPGRFDPARRPNQPLSFGAGAHYCLGAALARLEAQIAFPLLLDRFPQLAIVGTPQRRDRLTLRGYASLPVATEAAV